MTDQPTAQGSTIPPPYVSPPKPRRRGLQTAGIIIGGLVLLLVGVGIGVAGKATPKPVTRTVTVPGPTVTITAQAAPAPTVTVTAKPAAAGATMPGDGTFVVGYKAGDWQPGTWQSGTPASGNCYWATLSNLSGTGPTSGVIANNNSAGPSIFTVTSGDVGVQVSGCSTWTKIG